MTTPAQMRRAFANIARGMAAVSALLNGVYELSKAVLEWQSQGANELIKDDIARKFRNAGAPTWAKLVEEMDEAAQVVVDYKEFLDGLGEENGSG